MRGNSASVIIAFVVMSASVTGCGFSDDGLSERESAAALGAAVNASAYVLTVSTETLPQDEVIVTSSDGGPARICSGDCQFSYLAGASLTLRIPHPSDRVNCLIFRGWLGACAGQPATCSLVLDSDLTTEAQWAPIRGCIPP